jgi:hypothetical protein
MASRDTGWMTPSPGENADPFRRIVLIAVVLVWAGMLALILGHPVFVAHDSISNYGHVWYVQERIWHDGVLPLSMPVIGHGDAFAFPYAFIPWVTAALLWPVLGSWGVTLWFVLGTVALIAATFWAFPELREGWWPAAVLVNPALVIAPIMGEMPFIWAIAMLLGAVGCWRRRLYWQAAVLAGLGQATHPAVVLPMAFVLVAGWWRWEPDRGRLLRCYAASLLLVVPAAWLVFASPVFVDSSTSVILLNFFGTVAVRGLVVLVPIGLVVLKKNGHALKRPARPASWVPAGAFVVLLALNVALMKPFDAAHAWSGLLRHPNTDLLSFIDSPRFVPGATYRTLRSGDGRMGMYELEQHGARLDSEFFPESLAQQSWPSAKKYSSFLRKRHVDFVIIFRDYDRARHTDEHFLLGELSARGPRGCGPDLVGVRRTEAGPDFDVYQVRRAC